MSLPNRLISTSGKIKTGKNEIVVGKLFQGFSLFRGKNYSWRLSLKQTWSDRTAFAVFVSTLKMFLDTFISTFVPELRSTRWSLALKHSTLLFILIIIKGKVRYLLWLSHKRRWLLFLKIFRNTIGMTGLPTNFDDFTLQWYFSQQSG